MHFFLKCMCFTRKGMCSSAMNNVPNGTTLYYLAGISTALHTHSLMTMSTAPQEDTHQPCHSQVLMHMCRNDAVLGNTNGRGGEWSHFVGEYVC